MRRDERRFPWTWTIAKIGDLCTALQYGYTASAVELRRGPRFLRITDIQGGAVAWTSVPYCKIEKDQIAKYLLRPGDIVFARTGGTVGKSYIISSVPEPSIFASYLIRLTAHCEVFPKFLYYFFQSASYWEQIGLKKGGLQGNVNATTLSSLEIPVCPLNEQLRIVAKIEELFSKLDKGVEALTTAREQLKAYRQSVLKYAFAGYLTVGWRARHPEKARTRAQYVASIRSAKDARFAETVRAWQANGKKGAKPPRPMSDSELESLDFRELPPLPLGWAYVPFTAIAYSIRNGISKKPNETGALRIFRISAVRPMAFDLSDFRLIDADPEFESYRLQRGDVVFTRYNGSRAYVGVAALYRGDEGFVYPDKLIRCDVGSPLIDAGYIEKAVNCGRSRAFIEGRIRTTAGQSGISGADLKAMPVPICPIEEQMRINEVVEAQFSGIAQVDKEIEFRLTQAEALRQTILKKAFAGQLVAQEPKDEPAGVLLERIRAERESRTTTKELTTKNGRKRAA